MTSAAATGGNEETELEKLREFLTVTQQPSSGAGGEARLSCCHPCSIDPRGLPCAFPTSQTLSMKSDTTANIYRL